MVTELILVKQTILKRSDPSPRCATLLVFLRHVHCDHLEGYHQRLIESGAWVGEWLIHDLADCIMINEWFVNG